MNGNLQVAYRKLRADVESSLRGDLRSSVKRLKAPLTDVDPLTWLTAQKGAARLYWSGRGGNLQTAGIGSSWQSVGGSRCPGEILEGVNALLASDAELRVYGGFRFAERADVDDVWGTFGTCRFTLPAIEVCREYDQTNIYCNLTAEAGERILSVLNELEENLATDNVPFPVVLSRSDTPDRRGWTQNVDEATAAIARGEIEKIVLARRASLEFAEEHHAVSLLQRLKQGTPDCFHFLFDGEDGTSFIGASPERLYRRTERKVFSEAVAGTRPMGEGPEEADRLGRELLDSDKDLREHCYVRDHIRDQLRSLCGEVSVDANVSLLKLARGQHLFTAISGTLADGVTDGTLIEALHPTPAVGGSPTNVALKKIAKAEHFDRGWYAGPVGWIAADAAEFAVAIRSGLLEGRHLHLYSGAGIVEGSTPDMEWDEIEHKISDFIRVVTGE
ncbi:MAG: isochorismate synthase [Verrucomicrobia bacterium]|nr:isochorismate synthase [Verrucomicrobiota bacterium]